MNIGVISNCQGEGVAKCIIAMNPSVNVNFFMSTDVMNGTHNIEDIFSNHQYVVLQKSALDTNLVEQHKDKIIMFPSIAFSGFHPDMTYVRGKNKNSGAVETVFTPMYSYNSSIVLYAFLKGKSRSETLEMFSAEVFERLGFFREWHIAKQLLIEEADSVDLDIRDCFRIWEQKRNFMYSFNHPHIDVVGDVAKLIMKKMGVPVLSENACQYVADPLAQMPVWPVYPEIASRYGFVGDYAFKQNEKNDLCNLKDFIQVCFENYNNYEVDTLEPLNFSLDEYDNLLNVPIQAVNGNPYKNLPKYQFWKRAVSTVEPEDVDPVVRAKFRIEQNDKVATAGSCFAQHIAKTLVREGFNYFVTENAPNGMAPEQAHEHNYGVFSARYGNVYSVKQLSQLLRRAYGEFEPLDQYWLRADGQYIDPFRPQIEPNGFNTIEDLRKSQDVLFKSVQYMIENMNVFVFTLGLTETWQSKLDGAVFPLAPGVVAKEYNSNHYEFVNFEVAEVIEDLFKSIDFINRINPNCRILLTVSPVPLIATYEDRHVLVSTIYSKSVLRVAADSAERAYTNVAYFPSYDIFTGTFSKGGYYDEDQRTVLPKGVSHVMRLFAQHYMYGKSTEEQIQTTQQKEVVSSVKHNVFDIVCDEEAIENFNK